MVYSLNLFIMRYHSFTFFVTMLVATILLPFYTSAQNSSNVICGTPLYQSYCYGNNDNTTFLYTSPNSLSPLSIRFFAGNLEKNFDFITIYDGSDNSAPILYQGDNGGDLTGLTINSTGPNLYFAIDSDISVSCQNAPSVCACSPWNWNVVCGLPQSALSNPSACQLGANVNFTIPDPIDNCPGVTSIANPTSGSFFGTGTTQVTVTATDAGGNTDQCTFNVIVNDIEAPSIVCPSDMVVDNDNGACNAVVNYSDPVVDDNCTVVGPTINCVDINQLTFDQTDLIVPNVYRGFYFKACEDGVIGNVSVQIGGQGNNNVNTVFIYSGQSGCGTPIATKTGVTLTGNSVNTIDLTTGVTGSTEVVKDQYYHVMIRPVSGFFRIGFGNWQSL